MHLLLKAIGHSESNINGDLVGQIQQEDGSGMLKILDQQ
jgi:hypothetical protein